MKLIRAIFAGLLLFWGLMCLVVSAEEAFHARILSYSGKSFWGIRDPEYVAYDQALRGYLVNRIKKRFGVELDPKQYSGFDLLEIEALFACKKPGEPFENFLKMFPKHR